MLKEVFISALKTELNRLQSKRYGMSMYLTQEDLENDKAINERHIIAIENLLTLYKE